jgi:hypothetical protein
MLRIYRDDVPTKGAETVGERIRRASLQALRKLAAKLGVTPLYLEVGRDDATCPHCGRAP